MQKETNQAKLMSKKNTNQEKRTNRASKAKKYKRETDFVKQSFPFRHFTTD